jgi:hypothetical protein
MLDFNEELLFAFEKMPYEMEILLASICDVISIAFLSFIEMLFVRYLCIGKSRADKRFWIFTSALFTLNSLNAVILYDYCRMRVFSTFLSYLINIVIPLIYLFVSFKSIDTILKIIPPFFYQVLYMFSYVIVSIFAFNGDFTQTIFSTGKDRALLVSSTLVVQCLILLIVYHLYNRITKSKNKFNFLYLTVILPFLLAIYVMLYPLGTNYEEVPRYFGIYMELGSILFFAIIFLALLLAVGIYLLLYEMWQKNKFEKEKELYENMLQLEKKRYEDISSSSMQIKKIRHDIKNMLFSVKAELDENNLENSKEKLDEILSNVNSIGDIIESKNRTVDCIVNSKLGSIENRNVAVSGDVSGLNNIKDVDISIILGNILDNAIEATSNIDNATIKLTFFIKGNYQNIICENTVCHTVLSDNPKLSTTKKEKSTHGFGIKSVKDTVNTYNGTVDFFEKDNVFNVHIMIPV